MKNYEDKSELVIDLQTKGYDQDFIIYNEGILCIQDNNIIATDEFEIIESYFFKSNSDRADDYIIYAINCFNYDIKGILMTSFSTYNRGVSIHLWCKLSHSIKMALEEISNRNFTDLALN